MSSTINPQDIEQEAMIRKVFRMFADSHVKGMNEDIRGQVVRIMDIAKIESPNEPMKFIDHLNSSTPMHFPMGQSGTRLGQVLAGAEMYTKTAKKRRDAAIELFNTQKKLAEGNEH